MKIDRLLSIITYLLNRDLVTGKYLADKFDVTERTIQRDIETINLAGIPIMSIRGKNGGYKILDTYRLSKQTSTDNDLESIRLALESLSSALDDKSISSTLEKVKSIGGSKDLLSVKVDFGVAKENKRVSEYVKIIENAIASKNRLEFLYTNANNHTTVRTVEPVMLNFKWYTWYLVAFCIEKNEYRIFKLIRMEDLKITNYKFKNNHDNNPNLFDDLMSNDYRNSFNIIFKCNKDISTSVLEYIHNVNFTEINGEYYIGRFRATENERMWFAFLLSFGDDIEIIEPEHLRNRLLEHSKKIINKYEIPDT